MTTLLQILAATLLSSILSIVLAGLISFKFLDRYMSKMLCISAGLLLTVAFTHLLPEAFEIHENAVSVGWTLLVSVLFLVRPAWRASVGCKSRTRPMRGRVSDSARA